jgi:hypothetical protein
VRVGEEKAEEKNEGKEDREGHVTNYVKQVFNSLIDHDLKVRSRVPGNMSYRGPWNVSFSDTDAACFTYIIP